MMKKVVIILIGAVVISLLLISNMTAASAHGYGSYDYYYDHYYYDNGYTRNDYYYKDYYYYDDYDDCGGCYSNHAPVWNTNSTKYGQTGRLLRFSVDAYDPDGDRLTYYAMYLPVGASFNRNSRTFSWIPSEAGTYSAKFRVFDEFDSYSDLRVKIVIRNSTPVTVVYNNSSRPTDKQNKAKEIEVLQPIFIENTKVVEKTVVKEEKSKEETAIAEQKKEEKKLTVAVDNANCDVGKLEDVQLKDKITLAATMQGIVDNFILNPWFLLIVIAVLVFLSIRFRIRLKDLEQEMRIIQAGQSQNQDN